MWVLRQHDLFFLKEQQQLHYVKKGNTYNPCSENNRASLLLGGPWFAYIALFVLNEGFGETLK